MGETKGSNRVLVRDQASLVGRDRELAVMREAVRRAADGHGSILVLEGEAGLGKTRLVREVATIARSMGCACLHAAADELEQDRPFSAYVDVFGEIPEATRDLKEEFLALALGEPRLVDDEVRDGAERYKAIDVLVDLVESVALRQPILLSVEDLHWADETSVLATNRLARRLPELPAVMVVSLRPFPRAAWVTKLLTNLDKARATSLRLDPLGEEDSLALAGALSGAELGSNLTEKVRTTAGNPLFITELINALSTEGRLRFAEQRVETDAADVPASLRMTLLRRLAFLDEEALEVLRAGAILGTTFSLGQLAVTTARALPDLRGSLSGAFASGLMVDRGNEIAFKHDLVREALYEDLPASLRGSLHLDAGFALASAGDDLAAATHLVLGAEPGDLAAVTVLERAARRVARTDPRAAADLLLRALEIVGSGSPDVRARLLVDRTFALLWAGAMEDAEPVAAQALSSDLDLDSAADLRIAMTRGCIIQGRLYEAEAHADAGLALDGIRPEARAHLLVERCFISLFTGRFDEMDELARSAIDLAREVTVVAPHALSLTALGLRSLLQGRVQDALSKAREVLTFHDPTGQLQRHAATLLVPIILIEADLLDDAQGVLSRGIRHCETIGAPWLLPSYHGGMARIHLARGDWDAAAAELETSLELAEDTGNTGSNPLVLALLGEIELHRGDLESCRRRVAAAEQIVAEYGGMHWHAGDAMEARAKLLEAEDEAQGVAAVLGNLWILREAAGLLGANQSIAVRLTRAAMRVGDLERARHVAATAERMASEIGTATAKGWALHARGLVTGESEPFLEAVETLRSSPRVLELAGACEDAASVIASHGDAAQAKDLLATAAEIYDRVGARFDTDRVESRLRALGVRRGPSSAHVRARTGWESLTPTENKIVALVAEGLRNRQIAARLFLSVRTVETHLSHVYDKLGIRSRTELVSSYPRAERARDESD
jgi:DNA-binding CsgD family transcriptional regulator